MSRRTDALPEKTLVPLDRHQLSLMHVFRAAHQSRDAAKVVETIHPDGSRELTERSKERRSGTDEGTLRKHLTQDLASLMNTINLDAVVPLDDYPYIRRSVVNFGFGEMGGLSSRVQGPEQIAAEIRKTLIAHEPRLIAETLEVTVSADSDLDSHMLSFDISAEMTATPADIPLSFVAEVDRGAGKMQMTRLRVQT